MRSGSQAAGFFGNEETRDLLKTDDDLKALHGRADYEGLLREAEEGVRWRSRR